MGPEEVLLTGGRAVAETDHLWVERLGERDLACVAAREGRRDLPCDPIAQLPGFLRANPGQEVREEPSADTPCHADGWRRCCGGAVQPPVDVQLLVDRGAVWTQRGGLSQERGLHRGQDLAAERTASDRVERNRGSGLTDCGRQLLTKIGVGGVHDVGGADRSEDFLL